MLRSVGKVPTVPHFDIGGYWKGSNSASFQHWGVLEGFRQCPISILGGVGRVPTVPHFNIGGCWKGSNSAKCYFFGQPATMTLELS
jgi:hypothetical protein